MMMKMMMNTPDVLRLLSFSLYKVTRVNTFAKPRKHNLLLIVCTVCCGACATYILLLRSPLTTLSLHNSPPNPTVKHI